MRSLIALSFTALIVLAPAAHAQDTRLPSVEMPTALDRVLRDYEQGWRQGDAPALAALFTEDGFILRPGHPPVRGRAAIEAAYEGAGGPLVLRALEYAQADSVGYIIGAYGYGNPDATDAETTAETATAAADTGKFILALRRGADGRWLIAADMDNGNR